MLLFSSHENILFKLMILIFIAFFMWELYIGPAGKLCVWHSSELPLQYLEELHKDPNRQWKRKLRRGQSIKFCMKFLQSLVEVNWESYSWTTYHLSTFNTRTIKFQRWYSQPLFKDNCPENQDFSPSALLIFGTS